jgi:hypothetical protein
LKNFGLSLCNINSDMHIRSIVKVTYAEGYMRHHANVPLNTVPSIEFRTGYVRAAVQALWTKDHEVLDDAALELGVDLEIFAAEGDLDVTRSYPLADVIALFQAWLKATNFPDWEPCCGSALDELTEQELYLALAQSLLDLSRMSSKYQCGPQKKIEHIDRVLTDSERALAHAESLAHLTTSVHLN